VFHDDSRRLRSFAGSEIVYAKPFIFTRGSLVLKCLFSLHVRYSILLLPTHAVVFCNVFNYDFEFETREKSARAYTTEKIKRRTHLAFRSEFFERRERERERARQKTRDLWWSGPGSPNGLAQSDITIIKRG